MHGVAGAELLGLLGVLDGERTGWTVGVAEGGAHLVGAVAEVFLPGTGQIGTGLAGVVGQVTYGLPYSRLHETEADRMGVELAARAGYDPRAAITLWEKMAKLSGGGSAPSLLSTHPSNEERINDLKVFSQKVMPLYEKARAGK